ncbi:cellulose-binding domain-containing protein [Plantactinospora sp. KBS50]|uniref:cellulose-binding domain-containing protein n=1 Tax=Plantactinospora sp. KBS50 TaxID=2024580 RepID=UPI001E3C832C|nr:cellulose-binding domain-containing protein [Plantactinospora sp. KBS50]
MKRITAIAAAGVLLTGAGVALSPQAFAAAGCQVSYTVTSQWQGGFQGDVKITNLGDPISTWSLGFDFASTSQQVTQGWNATWSQSGQHVTATSLSWNGSLGTSASTSIGFLGSWSGSNPVAGNFTLNGTACNGGTAPPTTTPPTTAPRRRRRRPPRRRPPHPRPPHPRPPRRRRPNRRPGRRPRCTSRATSC